MKFQKKHVKILGWLISIIFLYLTFKNTNFSLILEHFKYINPYLILIAFVFDFVFFAIRGFYQINNLLYIKPNIRFSISFSSIAVAQFYNNIFPARLGEVIRTFFLSKRENIQKITILSYIFIEKIIDFIFVFFLFLLIVVTGFKGFGVDKVIIATIFVLAFIITGLIVYIRFNLNILNILLKIAPEKFHDLLQKLNSEVLNGLKFYQSVKQVAIGISLMLASWIIIMLIFWLISYPYVKLLGLPYYSCLFFMVFSVISLSVPSAPSGIGVMHYGLFLAVKLLIGNPVESQINMIAAFVIVLHFFLVLLDIVASGTILISNKIFNKDDLLFLKASK